MDKIDEIKQRLSEISLSISRVPTETKRSFISLANAEFSGDYGMALKFIHDQAFEYQTVKALFFNKLESMENKIDSLTNKNIQKEQNPQESVKTFSGRRIEIQGGEKNGKFE